MPTLFLGSAVVLLVAVATPAAQQGTSEVRGRIADQHGGVLPGVTVILTNEDTGVFRETISGADGSYFASQLLPGRYRIVAKLAGFRTLEPSGFVLQLGTTLTINLTLEIGPREETVTVTTTTPLIHLASTQVGGNIGTAELTELPAINRSYFATVALLPGIQLLQTNQMGNDTIIANGQHPQNTNTSVDGGYNTDDSAGGTFGAQVRTPLESIQEFQVGDQHVQGGGWSRGRGDRQCRHQTGHQLFSGVVFVYGASNRLTAADFFTKKGNLAKAQITKRDWGFVFGGPVIRNKAHFFFSLERQVDKPNRTRVFTARPSLNFSIAEDRTGWNTLVRLITKSTRTTPGRSAGCARSRPSIRLSDHVPLRKRSTMRPTSIRCR